MYILLLILAIIAAVLLTLVVLIQNPKGGGIDSSFGAANQLGSVKKTTDVVEKATWYLAGFILVVSIATTAIMSSPTTGQDVSAEENKLNTNYAQENFNTLPSTPSNGVK